MNPSILVVDDSIMDRQFYQLSLSADFDLSFVSNGYEALKALKKFHPDLIVTDVVMPQCDGIAFVDGLHNRLNRRDIPVVVVTADSDPDFGAQMLQLGVIDLQQKPITPKLFCQQLKNIIQVHQCIRSKAAAVSDLPKPQVAENDPTFKDDFEKALAAVLCEEEVNLSNLARSLNVSVPTLQRKVKFYYGCSPMKLISDRKLDMAHRLLQDGAYSVKEAAYSVGFVSSSYFIRSYKKKYGKTPGSLNLKN